MVPILKEHGHGQVNTGGDHGQQGHKGHQPPQHPPPLQCSAGQAALLAFFPLYRVALAAVVPGADVWFL